LLGGLGAGLAAAVTSPLLAREPGQAAEPWSPKVSWIDLWPGNPPGLGPVPPVETIVRRAGSIPPILEITGVLRSRLMVLRPDRPNGSSALVIPGGGYARLVTGPDGPEIARWLTARGWTVFVLVYRLPGDGWVRRADVPLQDGQRAVRLIRERAGSYGIDPRRLAAIGSSAGGHLCADLATRFDARTYDPVDQADRHSARPDLAVLLYPVQTLADPMPIAARAIACSGKVHRMPSFRRTRRKTMLPRRRRRSSSSTPRTILPSRWRTACD
jgi:acetyl esterase/lipase